VSPSVIHRPASGRRLHLDEPGKGILDRGGRGGVPSEHVPGVGRAGVPSEHVPGVGRAGLEAAEPENGHSYPSCRCMSDHPHAMNPSQGWASPEGAHAGGIFWRGGGHDGAGGGAPCPAREGGHSARSARFCGGDRRIRTVDQAGGYNDRTWQRCWSSLHALSGRSPDG
jgi:hypothetical protein